MNFGMREALDPLVERADRIIVLLEQLVQQRGEPLLPHPPTIDVTPETTEAEIGDAARVAVRAVRKGKR